MLDKTSILREAQKLLAKGAVDKAVAELDKLVRESPDGNIFNMIGDIYLKKGSQKAAVEYYLKAANFFRQEGFSSKAQALYKKVLNINPVDTDALYAFGEISEEKGLVTDAIKYYLATADLLAKEGKKDKILFIYRKIISLSPSNIPLRIKVAEIFIKEGLKTDASNEYLYIAKIYDEQGEYEKAKEFFQKTIELQPLNKEAVLGLNYLYEKMGEQKHALDQIREATVLFPEEHSILFRCADLSLCADNTRLASECLQKVIAVDANNLRARRMLGEIYMKSGDTEKAWQQYLPVLDEMLDGLGYDESVSFVSGFKEIDPVETGKKLISLHKNAGYSRSAADELIALGDLYMGNGLEEEAKACMSEAAEIDPENPEIARRNAQFEAETATPELSEELNMQGQETFELNEESISNIFKFSPETDMTEQKAEEGIPSVTETADQVILKSEKSYDEVITEADIFSRYGLLNEALRLLEGLKMRFPEDIEVHRRLKSIYIDTQDNDSAVTECIILSELYKRVGDTENFDKFLKEAYEINPSDPRLAGRVVLQPAGEETYAMPHAETHDIEDYEEEIAEADFYSRQGLTTEAIKILEKLNRIFPDNSSITERLKALGQSVFTQEPGQVSGVIEMPEIVDASAETPLKRDFEFSSEFEQADTANIEEPGMKDETASSLFKGFDQLEKIEKQAEIQEPPPEDMAIGETADTLKAEQTGQKTEEPEFEDFSLAENDLTEAVEVHEPSLDNDVLEIFHEFKKGLEKELVDEDSETHYNLGIAYKEMGLVDDAIKEFQTSRNDPKKLVQSSTMLGICYMEKGLYSLAIDILSKALEEIKEKDETYRAIQYDLAEAFEKNGDIQKAVEVYTEVYGWNAKFRSVSDKMSALRGQLPKADDQDKDRAKTRKDRVSYL